MTNVQLEQLLKHASFLRAFAKSLLRDAARAEDVVQETWLVALKSEKTPDQVRPGWLAGIVKNLARRALREDERRTRRERAAARPDAEPATDEVIGDAMLRRRLAEHVLALPDRYRDPILLRYYDGLTPQEIGARLGVPASTIRTRLQRGLARVRQTLGNGRGLGAALSAIAAGHGTAGAATAVRTTGIAAAAVVLVACLLGGARVEGVRGPRGATADASPSTSAPPRAGTAAPPLETRSVTSTVRTREARVLEGVVHLPAGVHGPARVRVVDGERATAWRAAPGGTEFRIPLREGGVHVDVEADHPAARAARVRVRVGARAVLRLERRSLVPEERLPPRDSADGGGAVARRGGAAPETTAGAPETFFDGDRLRGIARLPEGVAARVVRIEVATPDGAAVVAHVRADRVFALPVRDLLLGAPRWLRVRATHPETMPAEARAAVAVDPRSERVRVAAVELELAAAREIEGTVVFADGTPVDGATVGVFADDALAAAATADGAGAFALAAPADGEVLVVAAAEGYRPAVRVVADTGPLAFVLDEGAVIDGGVAGAGAGARLTARRAGGAGADLELGPGAVVAWSGGVAAWRSAAAETDAEGRYRLAGLERDDYELELAFAAYTEARTTRAPATEDFAPEAASVRLLVRDAAGPVAGATVRRGDAGVGVTGADGVVAAPAPPHRDAVFTVEADGYEALALTVAMPGHGEVALATALLTPVPAAAGLLVRLRANGTAPLPKRCEFLLAGGALRSLTLRRVESASDVFALPDVAPGDYLLAAYPDAANPYLPASTTVTVAVAGTTEVSLTLDQGGRVHARIVGAPGAQALFWLEEDGAWLSGFLLRDPQAPQLTAWWPLQGEWTSEPLAPGRYRLWVEPGDPALAPQVLPVEVRAGETTSVEVRY